MSGIGKVLVSFRVYSPDNSFTEPTAIVNTISKLLIDDYFNHNGRY